jgi:hypothetical protein
VLTHLGAFLQNRPRLLSVDGLGGMTAGMANKPCDLLDRHAIVGTGRDQRVPQVRRRPVPAKPGPSANVLEHLPEVPRTQRRTGGRGEHPAGSLRTRSGSLLLSRLVHLPLPERPAAICARSTRGGTSTSSCLLPPGPRAAPRPTDDCRPGRRPPPSYSPGPPRGARQPYGLQRCRRASGRPGSADPSAPRAAPVPAVPAVGARRALWPKGMLPWPLGALPPCGSMHRWFPAVVTGPPISVSKRPSGCKSLVGATGFEPVTSRL